MNIALTHASEEELGRILSSNFTPAMAAEYLREERISLRNFGETLQEIYPDPDLSSRLVTAFLTNNPGVSPDSVQRRIRNWLSGCNQPSNREDIFRIAFALDLTEQQTNYLLGLCTDYGIHYREGRDVIYSWFLRTDRGYSEARDFFASLPPIPRLEQVPDNPSTHITRELQNIFAHVQTLDELRECYLDNLENFGILHMRAYSYFDRYLEQLLHPASSFESTIDPDYSLEAVMDLYLSLKMPSGKSRSGYNVTQKLIKQNWPNTTALKNIRNHKEDVSRKLLLLLYVITENVLDGEYSELDEEYITLQERVEDHWWTINAILTDCGMPLLDPRNATDWLVLYAITATDEPMSERIEQVIEFIFADV